MHHFWWFVHILGISLWLGASSAVLLVWPSRKTLGETSPRQLDVRTLVTLYTRTGHIGAGLTALAGVILSFMEQPKSQLGTLWITSMQGLGAIAFIFSVIVMTRVGKRITRSEDSAVVNIAGARYHTWLALTVLLLLICLVMAAFKPTLYV